MDWRWRGTWTPALVKGGLDEPALPLYGGLVAPLRTEHSRTFWPPLPSFSLKPQLPPCRKKCVPKARFSLSPSPCPPLKQHLHICYNSNGKLRHFLIPLWIFLSPCIQIVLSRFVSGGIQTVTLISLLFSLPHAKSTLFFSGVSTSNYWNIIPTTSTQPYLLTEFEVILLIFTCDSYFSISILFHLLLHGERKYLFKWS